MKVRDAKGRQVSLLNDETHTPQSSYFYTQTSSQFQSIPNQSPFPSTPELLRSDSYDSNASFDVITTPLTPAYDYSPRPVYEDYAVPEKKSTAQRPGYFEKSRSNSYEGDSANPAAVPEKGMKRYPCRYRESHGCDKSFTTSGHASRHSKIHTAEKAVQCTYPGCHKKFTRADNMKQHLETHFKDKDKRSASKAPKSSLASTQRPSIPSRSSSISSHPSPLTRDTHMWDADYYGPDVHPSPTGSAWDAHVLNGSPASRPVATRTSSGLDALAAIACQEGV